MISVPWAFAGILLGLLIVSVFNPAKRGLITVPTPEDHSIYKTSTGCVKIHAKETECTSDAVSLNVIAGK